MSEEIPNVANEIDGYRSSLESMVNKVQATAVCASQSAVNGRFVRDCKQLLDYMDEEESPSTADLNDFFARHRSLEIQCSKLIGKSNGKSER